MCVTVWDTRTKTMLGSPDELAAVLGGREHIKVDRFYNEIVWEACLCQVDVESSLQSAGRSWREDEHDSMRVVMV